jgi:Holliday junction resolvasome RuvABC endonuclease subunit
MGNKELAHVNLLCLDPGFQHLGWSIIRVGRRGRWHVATGGIISTKKSSKKMNYLEASDDARRVGEIRDELAAIVTEWNPLCICSEGVSYVRNAKVNFKIGMVWGLVHAFAIPVFTASPQEIKEACCGKRNASKNDVAEAMTERKLIPPLPERKTLHEHVWDSVAAGFTCATSPSFRMMIRATFSN